MTSDPYESFGNEQENEITGDLLIFSKGMYLAGRDKIPLAANTNVVAHMETLSQGWVRWAGSRPVESRMGRIADGYQLPPRERLGHNDAAMWDTDQNGNARDPWQQTMTIVLSSLTDGSRYTFTTSNISGRKALRTLAKEFARETRKTPGRNPVIQLAADSFDGTYGMVHTPKFHLSGWVKTDGEPQPQSPVPTRTSAKDDMNDDIPF